MKKKDSIKIVGRRIDSSKVNWEHVDDFLKLVIELKSKNKFIPKGIYKFKNHTENDKWTTEALTNQ